MYLEEETKKKFGHSIESLTVKSNKGILVRCDYCQVIFETTPKRRLIGHSVIKTDCCGKCKYVKMKDMNQLKYGVDNVFQLESVKEKMKETCLEKYGVEFSCQIDEIKEKREAALTEKRPEINEKRNKTCLEKYGSENVASNELIKKKVRETNLKKYGNSSYLRSDDCRAKYIEKVGCDNIFRTEEFQVKRKEACLEKYGVDNHMKVPEIAKSIGAKSRQTKLDHGDIKLYRGRLVREWAEEVGFSHSTFNTLVNKHGWDIAVGMSPRMSSLEVEMENILKEIGVGYERQVKIGSCYADFVIGELIIECDGLYWHSEYHKEDSYHKDRLLFYKEKGYKALFFREDEIKNNPQIVKSIIKNKLGLSNRVFARKCSIDRITKTAAKKFLKENHLMGPGRGDAITLTIDGEILALFQVVKIKDGWELSRFATKKEVSVIGGFSKLYSFFLREYSPKRFITFIDKRYGSGEYLEQLGLKNVSEYMSFRWTNGQEALHRMKFRSNSGYDFGFYKIWDCGQAKYSIDFA